jgi:hypothetical protein
MTDKPSDSAENASPNPPDLAQRNPEQPEAVLHTG